MTWCHSSKAAHKAAPLTQSDLPPELRPGSLPGEVTGHVHRKALISFQEFASITAAGSSRGWAGLLGCQQSVDAQPHVLLARAVPCAFHPVAKLAQHVTEFVVVAAHCLPNRLPSRCSTVLEVRTSSTVRPTPSGTAALIAVRSLAAALAALRAPGIDTLPAGCRSQRLHARCDKTCGWLM